MQQSEDFQGNPHTLFQDGLLASPLMGSIEMAFTIWLIMMQSWENPEPILSRHPYLWKYSASCNRVEISRAIRLHLSEVSS